MLDKNISTEQQTRSQAAFAARKEIMRAITEAQAKEHALYRDVAVSVGKHMTALCQAWTSLLLDKAMRGGPDVIRRLSTAAGIRCDQLNAWCNAQQTYDHAQLQLTNAKKALASAKLERSKYAGALWGAKDGYELQYAAADTTLEKAKKELDRQQRQAIEFAHTLDELSEKLLRNCIQQSAVVSTSAEFGLGILGVLGAMQAEARSLEQQHNEAQQELLGKMEESLNALRGHYQKTGRIIRGCT